MTTLHAAAANDIEFVELSNYEAEPLTLDGTRAAATDLCVDGSIENQLFAKYSPVGFDLLIHRIVATIITPQVCNPHGFGSGPALDHGLTVGVYHRWSQVRDLSSPLKTNGDLYRLAGVDVSHLPENRGYCIRWTLSHATGGRPVRFPAEYGIGFLVRDNLATGSLHSFHVEIQGLKVPS